MIPGIEINFGDESRVVPPLNLATLERMQKRLLEFKGGIDPDSVATVIDAAHSALKRNYPDVTREWVAENIDVGNMSDVMSAVMDVAGMRRRGITEGKAGAATSPNSTGSTSTAT